VHDLKYLLIFVIFMYKKGIAVYMKKQ